uniref:GPI inositol-deacylase n=1 Tax=Strongyloides stercoralis TaxID=6248 RepID=A0AAF5D587_STRER
MTSMWRYPKLYSLHKIENLKYNFYLYGEGNAGDAAMVRSIGSILQNKTERLNSSFQFNVFSAHFNEEFSIFDTKILKRQAKFLINSIIALEKLYKNKRTKKYVFMGHSMGGIVIKMALKESEWLRKNTAFILVMGTILKDYPIKITSDFINIYQKISFVKDVPVISMHGGFMDELIEESLTMDNNSLTFGLQGMDRVWSMADHKCLVWCNEAQRAISRLLFEYAIVSNEEVSITKFEYLVQRIFNSSTLYYKDIKKYELNNLYKQIDEELLNEGQYIFVIGKTDLKFPLIYIHKNKNDINLYPAKTYFYSHKMKYLFSLETIEINGNYYINKNTKIKVIKRKELKTLNLSILNKKFQFKEKSGSIKAFIIPFLSTEIIYKVSLISTNNSMSKIYFKEENQQAISMTNKLIFNFFDRNTKSDGILFIISNSDTFFDNFSEVEYELNYKIDFTLTILKIIKINISKIPFLLSFMATLFSLNTNMLLKILSLLIILYTVTSSIIMDVQKIY